MVSFIKLHDIVFMFTTFILSFQKLSDEVEQWQKRVDALNHMSRKLQEEYSNCDDTTKVKTDIDKINARWTHLLSR